MYRYLFILTLGVFFLTACEKEDNTPDQKGEVTISSEIFGSTVYYVNGFSFEEEKYVPSLNPGGSVADVIPVNELEVTGEVFGMAFSAGPGNTYGFYKNFESSNLQEAENFYASYSQVETGELSELTDTLEAGQVYTFKTYKENYVKFLIRDVRLMKQSALSDYVEADIVYNIQRNGTDVFED
ncbi:MAG: hypothetical protein ACP5E3_01615 [Bacteroidales bacterium]